MLQKKICDDKRAIEEAGQQSQLPSSASTSSSGPPKSQLKKIAASSVFDSDDVNMPSDILRVSRHDVSEVNFIGYDLHDTYMDATKKLIRKAGFRLPDEYKTSVKFSLNVLAKDFLEEKIINDGNGNKVDGHALIMTTATVNKFFSLKLLESALYHDMKVLIADKLGTLNHIGNINFNHHHILIF